MPRPSSTPSASPLKSLLYEVLHTAARLEAEGARVLKPFGLTPMTFNILNLVADAELTQSELSDRLIVNASSVTFQFRQLQRRRLVTRRPRDQRTWLVSLTAEGRALRDQAAAAMDRRMARLRAPVREARAAEQLLQEVRRQLSAPAERGAGAAQD